MNDSTATARHILMTFLAIVAERGLAATTTKVLAEAAGVNEVTIFRLFTDKAGVVMAAFRVFDLAGKLEACAITVDAATPASAAASLLTVLRSLREQLHIHRALVQFGVSEYQKYPQLRDEAAKGPAAARHILSVTLESLRPQLRPEVDIPTTVLSLMGFLLLTALWSQNGWLDQSGDIADSQLAKLIDPLINWNNL